MKYKVFSNLNKNAGFTLIELVIVIVILGILSVVAAPKAIKLKSDANRAVIKGAVGSVESAISLFKSKTLTSGIHVTAQVTFSGITGSHYQPWAASYNGKRRRCLLFCCLAAPRRLLYQPPTNF